MIRPTALLLVLASTACAMVISDSRVLSLSELENLGVQVAVAELPGPKDARKFWITATVTSLGGDRKFRSVGYSILEKALDADFASTEAIKTGVRDSKTWAKEIRGKEIKNPFLRFNVSESEFPFGYLIVRFDLPPDDGIPVFGNYYLPLMELRNPAMADVAAATDAWIEAFASHDAARIAALYAPDAVFWGTNSPTIRDTPALVQAYFEGLKNRPTVRIVIDEQHVRVYGDTAVNTGRYSVHEIRDGQPTVRPLRFSFTYRRQDGRWLIVSHHSSAMPP